MNTLTMKIGFKGELELYWVKTLEIPRTKIMLYKVLNNKDNDRFVILHYIDSTLFSYDFYKTLQDVLKKFRKYNNEFDEELNDKNGVW